MVTGPHVNLRESYRIHKLLKESQKMMNLNPLSRRDFLSRAGATASVLALGEMNASSMARKPAKQPNVLIIMTDQQRWDALSRAGNKILHTPNLDRLAQEGAYFETVVTPCPVCCPARASILTGCSKAATNVGRNPDSRIDDKCPRRTFDDILTDHGYHTEYYGKWHSPINMALNYKSPVRAAGVSKTKLGLGLGVYYLQHLDKHCPIRELRDGEQYDVYSRRPYHVDPIDKRYGLKPGEPLLDKHGHEVKIVQPDCHGCLMIDAKYSITALEAMETIEALDRLNGEVPFSITCSFHYPHSPMVPTEPYYSEYPPETISPPASIDDPMDNSPYRNNPHRLPEYADKNKIRYMMSNYYGLVKEIDDWVGRILDKLDERGFSNNTLVVFMSDHGEMLGSHGMREKNVFYEESVRVPLIMRMPGVIKPGTVVSRPISTIDVYETILDYTGVKGPASQGRSLRDLIEGRKNDRPDYVCSEWDYDNVPNFMVRTEEWKFMFARTPESRALNALYNLKDDPLELNNLIGKNPDKAKYVAQAEKMKERLVEWLEFVGSPYLQGVKDRAI